MIFAGLRFSCLFTFPSMIHFHGSLLPHGEVTAQTFAPRLGLLLSEAAVCLSDTHWEESAACLGSVLPPRKKRTEWEAKYRRTFSCKNPKSSRNIPLFPGWL